MDDGVRTVQASSEICSGSSVVPMSPLDLDGIEADLAAVEVALSRLDDGTYWTDEVTGETLPDDLLAQRPAARRASA